MLYQLYEMQHAAISPIRMIAGMNQLFFRNEYNPLSYTPMGRMIAAASEVLEHSTRRYERPEFGIHSVEVDGKEYQVVEQEVQYNTFCTLLHFHKEGFDEKQPRVLIVAPMSGHYATLLRDTVRRLLSDCCVYITDWQDAQMVPVQEGKFDLDDYIDYIEEFLTFLGPNTHVLAVCQPSVPVMAATAVMNEYNHPCAPASMTLMGGPIDTRLSPTAVNDLAAQHSMEWFEENVIQDVPAVYPGFTRKVYPGFLQLAGFMSMNMDRHVDAHVKMYNHLVAGDGDSAQQHQDFYEEYRAVMDLPAEFYLQTIKTVFKDHALPEGTMMHNGLKVDPSKITKTALLTVEGEKDDITGLHQTEAAQGLCSNLPADMKHHHLQEGVGHYGVFNGRRWRTLIAPIVVDFMRKHDHELGAKQPVDTKTPANAAE